MDNIDYGSGTLSIGTATRRGVVDPHQTQKWQTQLLSVNLAR
jgi:hypothetical protein